MSEIFKTKTPSLAQVERNLQKVENRLYEECTNVVFSAVTHSFDVDPTSEELPARYAAGAGSSDRALGDRPQARLINIGFDEPGHLIRRSFHPGARGLSERTRRGCRAGPERWSHPAL